MKPSDKFEEIKTLPDHPGWKHLLEALNQDKEKMVDHWVENRPISDSEADFRRGVVWAIRRINSLPEILKLTFENEYILSELPQDKEKEKKNSDDRVIKFG